MIMDIHFFREFCKPVFPLTEEEESCHGVMVAVIFKDQLLLVKRSITMPSHKGQVALIGGHRHKDEAFPLETTKREFLEETSLPLEHLHIIAKLPVVYTARDYPILPMLAYYQENEEFLLRNLATNGEWEIAFTVKLSYLLRDDIWMEANRIGKAQRQNLLFCPLSERDIHILRGPVTFPLMLWGASARVVESLRELILTIS